MKLTDIPEYVRVAVLLADLPDACRYAKEGLLDSIFINDPLIIAAMQKIVDRFQPSLIALHNVSVGHYPEMHFSIYYGFDSRESLLTFFGKFKLTLPTDVIKAGKIVEGKPFTEIIYIFKFEDLKFTLWYTREGLPTKNCKIVPNVTYDIACDIDGETTSDSKLPF